MLSNSQQKFTELIGRLIAFAYEQGYRFTFGDAFAAAGHAAHSLHYQRLAVDFNLFVGGQWIQGESEAWDKLAAFWKGLDPLCRWGGDIVPLRDFNHFSLAVDAADNRI